jgi:hypothetical protein
MPIRFAQRFIEYLGIATRVLVGGLTLRTIRALELADLRDEALQGSPLCSPRAR